MGSKGTHGVWKARTGTKGAEAMMTELDWLKESAIKEVATPMRRTLHVNFFNTLARGVAIQVA